MSLMLIVLSIILMITVNSETADVSIVPPSRSNLYVEQISSLAYYFVAQ